VQIVDPETGRKKSLTAPTREAAEQLKQHITSQVHVVTPLQMSDAIAEYSAYKAATVQPEWLRLLEDRLRSFLPDVPISTITPEQAEALYLAETRRIGRNGRLISASTHQHLLRNVKEFWAWLVKRKLARENPFAQVEPIGKANAGKLQPRKSDARILDAFLFERAERGDEGALALLMQMYLGNRSSEILSLVISDIERSGEKYLVTVQRGKTRNARRMLELYPTVGALLWHHCQGRAQDERVFAARLPRRPAPDWMNKRLKAFCKEAGLPLYCPHALRGLHSSLALESGATTHQVAAALGHASFSTTARHYADPAVVENARSRRVATALHGAVDPVQELAALSQDDRLRLFALLKAQGLK
jgi:integrase